MNDKAHQIKCRTRLTIICLQFTLAMVAISLWCGHSAAQSLKEFGPRRPDTPGRSEIQRAPESESPAGAELNSGASNDELSAAPASSSPPQFRIERQPLEGGSELLTIFARLDGARKTGVAPEVPLLSVVRDTLSDNDPENDRLRYIWMLTYTQPTMMKRIASAIPFLYRHVGIGKRASNDPPAPILDLGNTRRQTWNHFFWMGLQNIFLDSYGIPLKAASRSYRRNAADYRTAHLTQALSILGNYENLRQRSRRESELLALRPRSEAGALKDAGELDDAATPLLPAAVFTPGEMLELRARLILSDKLLGDCSVRISSARQSKRERLRLSTRSGITGSCSGKEPKPRDSIFNR
jgi:hypothetical protein